MAARRDFTFFHGRPVFPFVATLILACGQALAVHPSQPVESYIRTDFTSHDGLPSTIINEILQTRDGFLWLRMPTRIARFDGRHFVDIPLPVKPPIPIPTAMVEAQDGALWIGTPAGLIRIDPGVLDQPRWELTRVYHPGSGPSDKVACIHVSRDGTLWVGTDGGLFRFDHEAFSLIVPNVVIQKIEEGAHGHLLMATGDGFLELDGTRRVEHPDLASRLGVAPDKIYHVFEDRTGVRWFCTAAGLARQSGDSIQRLQPYGGSHSPEAYRIYEDPQGNVWAIMSNGLFRATTAGLEPVGPGIRARSVAYDRDGDLWIGTNGDGVTRLKDRAVRMFTTVDGLPNNVVMTALATSDGKLWVGNNCGGLSWFDGKRFHTYSERDGLTNSCVAVLAEDRLKNLWVGTLGGGIFSFHDGRFTQFSTKQGLPAGDVIAMLPARDGSLWIGARGNVARIRDDQVRTYTVADGLRGGSVLSLYQDRSGVIWVGTYRGLSRLVGDRFVPLAAEGDALCMVIGEDRLGKLYVGVRAKGVFRLEGNQFVPVSNALPQFYGMLHLGRDLWMYGNDLVRADGDALEVWAHNRDVPPSYTKFGAADGMTAQQLSGAGRPLTITPDGRIWLATLQGLAMFDTAKLSHSNRKPAVYIEDVTVGRSSQSPGKELTLAPGTHHVELHLGSIELRSPENIRFQYRLEGVDQEWLDAGPSFSAIYTDFKPGKQQFHVRACNGDGVWDPTGIVYTITRQPYYYENRMFRFAGGGSVIVLIALGYRLRLKQIAAGMNARLDERVAERTRLARDLHDTMLQTIHASAMMVHTAQVTPGNPAPTNEALEKLSGWLTRAIDEARAAVDSLRSSTTLTNDLAEAIRLSGEACVSGSSIRFSVSVKGQPREFHPIARDEIYQIACEAIRNACKHSGGTYVDVELTYARDLVIRVRDDGRGIGPEEASKGRPGHFGLKGMRERSTRIGGQLTILGSAHSGTEIRLSIPVRRVLKTTSRQP